MREITPEEFVEKYMRSILDTPLFNCAGHISPDYHGGMWKFEADGDIGYGYPDTDKTFHCTNPAAMYECDASAKVLGMAATLMYLNYMCWTRYEQECMDESDWFADRYYALRDWMFENFSEEDAAKVNWLLD